MTDRTSFIPLLVLVIGAGSLVGCGAGSDPTQEYAGPYPDNPYAVWRSTVQLPEGSPVLDHPAASDCGGAIGDEAIFDCVDEQFWRVFQRDVDDRKALWRSMVALEDRLDENADPLAKANFVFRRAQVAMTYVLEQADITPEKMATMSTEDFQLLGSMSNDMAAAVELDPDEPFYATWLDTVKIAMADRLSQKENVQEAVAEAWTNVENWNETTTRSTLVASLTGTTVGLSIASGVPGRTMELLETFACHPKVLMETPDAICGKGADRRSCLEWCLANSKKAPFGGPGFMYHVGESYARMGDAREATHLYQLALTLPGADVWPDRSHVEGALADMDGHVAQFTSLEDDQTASYVVYANSDFACRFCHGAP